MFSCYLGGEDGLIVRRVAQQRYGQLGGNVTEGRDLIRTGTPSEEDASGGIMKLLQGEETQTLHERPLHLQRPHQTFTPEGGAGVLNDLIRD